MIAPEPTDMFRRGEVLNNTYEILGVLGRGGTGEVYKARNAFSGRVMAIKALSAQFSRNQDALALMRREEEIRVVLHDAVVRYFDSSRTADGHVYLVMDFIDGPLLADLMEEEGGLAAAELLIVAERVASGLVAAHEKGIVHRDLSPDNIILRDGRADEAVIIDFGIAKDTAAGARTIVGNEFAGKYEYAAPEQLHGQATPLSDLYALGTTLLAAYRGEVPRIGQTPGEIVEAKMRPLDVQGVEEPLRSFVLWLSAPEASNRPPDAAAVVAHIQALSRSGRPIWRHLRRAAVGVFSAASMGVALWVAASAGLFERLFDPGPPTVSPFVLSAAAPAAEGARLAGYAPDDASAEGLRAAYERATGARPDAEALTIANGVPGPDWTEGARALLGAMALEDWSLEIADRKALVEGIARDIDTRDRVVAALEAIPPDVLDVTAQVAAGPRLLPAELVEGIAAAYSDCGPLSYAGSGAAPLRLGEPVVLSGAVSGPQARALLGDALRARIGDRPLRLELLEYGERLCEVRDVLPATELGDLAIDLRHGDTGELNPSAIFRVGDQPVIELRVPEADATGHLWVFVANPDGTVVNLLPHRARPEDQVKALGRVEGEARRIPVTHSAAARDAARAAGGPELLTIGVDDKNFGITSIFVLQTDRPAFSPPRPEQESAASTARAIETVLTNEGLSLLGIAMQTVETRP
ncbi:MAG: protein kinase [Pseudomonadota bacterium]